MLTAFNSFGNLFSQKNSGHPEKTNNSKCAINLNGDRLNVAIALPRGCNKSLSSQVRQFTKIVLLVKKSLT
ncbi:hypothetical protein H6G04_30140 [Calothrix membranacea FACHB-236]|nr:hypothetical protein [Calothrix membranacea FACHB-236]